jgi:hypothetical protein
MKNYTQFQHLNEATREDQDRAFITVIFMKFAILKTDGIYTRENVDKIMNSREGRTIRILRKYFEQIKIQDIRVTGLPNCLEFDFWLHPFSVDYTFIDDLEKPFFYCGPYLLSHLTPEGRQDLGQKFLKKLQTKITAEPSFFHQLPAKLQTYFQADFKQVGTDFGFLE